MIFALTSQKRGGYTRAVVATFETAADALDTLAMYCPEESMDYFTPGNSVLSLRNKILRAEILNKDDMARGWTLRFPRPIGGK